jgi:hypothetical protein
MNLGLFLNHLIIHPKVCKLNREFLAICLNAMLSAQLEFEQHLILAFLRSSQLSHFIVALEVPTTEICTYFSII